MQVSLGSDAVYAAEQYYAAGNNGNGTSAIEVISRKYGRQAVVISVDPKREYLSGPTHPTHRVFNLGRPTGPNGESHCWYACTVKGGREVRDIDAFELGLACEQLGAGEILLNSIDQDGQKKGFDLGLVQAMKETVSIPVIASSGAGAAEHFVDVFDNSGVEAALAAGIFHHKQVEIEEVKQLMLSSKLPTRILNSTSNAPETASDDTTTVCKVMLVGLLSAAIVLALQRHKM